MAVTVTLAVGVAWQWSDICQRLVSTIRKRAPPESILR